MSFPLVWIISGLLFAVLLISLGFQPKILNRLLGAIFLFVGVSGLLFYGFGYYSLNESGGLFLTVAKTVFWVFSMFLGRNDISTISKVPFLARSEIQIWIYLTHFLALYTTAGTVAAGIGTRLIRSLSLFLLHHKKINLIYGVHDGSLDFAAKLQQQDKGVLVFVGGAGEAGAGNRILRTGGILMNDAAAKEPSAAFLKKIRIKPGHKQLSVYCLSDDPAANLRYAEGMKRILEAKHILPEQCRISLLTNDEHAGAALQAKAVGFGFGSVTALEKEELMARLLIHEFPPCETMLFQAHGLADENFEALIVGFGRTGQAVLRQLLMNGQFAGSRFHATVVDRDHGSRSGNFVSRCSSLFEHYDIGFMDANAKSRSFYAYLEQHVQEFNYIAVCTGAEGENAEVSREIRSFLSDHGSRARVVECTCSSLTAYPGESGIPKKLSIYSPDILCGEALDEMAVQINHHYHLAEGHDARTDWAACDYFSRQSCRASADFIRSFLCAARLKAEEAAANGWPDDPELLEHLSETEHLRWCAFHYAMGYSPMPDEVFRARAQAYLAEQAEKGSSTIRVGKDTQAKFHACLIPWAELPGLERKEKELTGREVNYQQKDLDNVLLIPDLLRKKGSKG